MAAPNSYPVPGGTVYLSDQGNVALAPTGSVLQTLQFPAMGMFNNQWIPFAVNAQGALQVDGGGGGASNVNIHDASGLNLNSTSNALNTFVTNFPVSQDVNITNASIPVSIIGTPNVAVTSSVLPTGAATDASLVTINTTLGTPFQTGDSIANTSFGASQVGTWTTGRTWTLNSATDSVTIAGTIMSTNSANGNTGAAVPVQATQVGGSDGTDLQALSVDSSGKLNVNNISGTVSLPTGASTASNQSTANASLATIVTNTDNIPPLGQALSSASVPVVLPISQITALTPPTTVTVTQTTGTNLHAVIDSGSISVSNFPATQPVSGTISAVQSGAWTVAATQSGSWTTGRTWTLASGTDSVTAAITGTVGVTQSTSPWVVSGSVSVSNFPTVQPVSGTIAVTQSTSPWVVSGTVTSNIGTTNGLALDATVSAPQGSVAGGTAGSKSDLAGAIFNTSPPTLTNGQQVGLQVDASGSLKTTATLTASTVTANQGTPNTLANGWPVEITDGTNILGTPTHPIRTDPTGTTTQPISGTVTANQGGSWTVAATQSGTWSTGRTWTLSSGTDSVAATVSGTVGVTQSTSPWVVSGTVTANAGTGNFNVIGTGSAGTAATGVVTVQGIASGTAIPVSGSVSVSNFPVTTAVTQSTSPWVVSGTVTSNIGTTNGLALDTTLSATQGSVTGGTSGTKSQLGGAIFNTSPPTLTNGQQASLQLDASGNLKTTGTTTISGTVPVSQSGTWTVQQGTPPWSVSQSGTWTTGRTWTLSSGTDSVNIGNFPATQPVSGTVTTNQGTSPWVVSGTVTANAGTGNFNNSSVSATGAAPPASSTFVGGSVTTAAPTYTTGQMSALSLNTSGGLRVDGSGVTQPVSGTITANAGTGTFQTNITNASLPVTQSGTWTTGRTWSLSSGTDSVAAVQSTSPWVNNITQFGGVNLSTGTGTGGTGIPRVTVSNDSNILATQSGTWNINNVSGTISLPTGASTSALQTTISGQLPATLGAKTTANSLAVNIASDQVISVNAKQPITANSPSSVTVGVTSVVFLAANASRKGLTIMNTSAATVSFGWGVAAVLTSGITLLPGGTFNMDEFSYSVAAINAISSAAGAVVSLQEFQ